MVECEICGQLVEKRRLGPHISGHRRTERARYLYPNGSKSPHHWITCETCGEQVLAEVGHRYCSVRCSKMETLNPQWKGDQAPPNTARRRAHNRYRNDACSQCRSTERVERHHRNKNTYDNTPANIEILCHKCHAKAHRRLPRPICPTCSQECATTQQTYCSRACWQEDCARRRRLAS